MASSMFLTIKPEFGVAGDFQFAVEEQRVRVFLAGQHLQVGRQVGGEGQVRLAVGTENRTEKAVAEGVAGFAAGIPHTDAEQLVFQCGEFALR